MTIIIVIIIGIALSMDAFSLSICYGTIRCESKIIYKLSAMVGLCHVVMTTLGLLLGHYIQKRIEINTDIIVFITFFSLGILIIASGIKKESHHLLTNNLSLLIMSIGVSIDSFMVGVGSAFITENHVISPLLFGVISSVFTFFGLKMGSYLSSKLGDILEVVGGIIFIIYSIFSLL